jgi:RalA-binding protein 1
MLSRESRVSLPDEAKQYIANMADSPVASPRVDAFVAKFGAASRGAQPQIQIPDNAGVVAPGTISEQDSPGGTKEFLDLRDEDENEDEGEDEDESEDEDEDDDEDEDEGDGNSAITVPEADADSEILPAYSTQESLRSQLQVQESQQSELPAELQERNANSGSEVDEFPLPPSTVHLQEHQAMAHQHGHPTSQGHDPNLEMMTSTHTRPQQLLNSAAPPYPSTTDRLENPYSPPGQYQQHHQPLRMDSHHQHQQLVHAVPASFRALPLLSSDLPHTTITVSHSFVRPNDRGKEVLSFVVHVDPGMGKDGWKVEKMYSDVLGLDQRVRSSVAKGIGKKIASLPEGKLWKDHAPAKVDQRKVCNFPLPPVSPIM